MAFAKMTSERVVSTRPRDEWSGGQVPGLRKIRKEQEVRVEGTHVINSFKIPGSKEMERD